MFQAYSKGLKYPKYLFLTYDAYETQWWTNEEEEDTEILMRCSPEDRAEVLQFSLAVSHIISPSDEKVMHLQWYSYDYRM